VGKLKTFSDWFQAWLLWIAVTAVSWALGLVVALSIARVLGAILPLEVGLVIGGVAGGALIGCAQWLFLRPEVRGIGAWTVATAGGWVAGLVVTALAGMVTDLAVAKLAGGVLGGLTFGLAQWPALHPERMRRGEWLLVTITSWTAALALPLTFPQVSEGSGILADETVGTAMAGAVGFALIGVVALTTLVLLFPRFWKRSRDDHGRWFLDRG